MPSVRLNETQGRLFMCLVLSSPTFGRIISRRRLRPAFYAVLIYNRELTRKPSGTDRNSTPCGDGGTSFTSLEFSLPLAGHEALSATSMSTSFVSTPGKLDLYYYLVICFVYVERRAPNRSLTPRPCRIPRHGLVENAAHPLLKKIRSPKGIHL